MVRDRSTCCAAATRPIDVGLVAVVMAAAVVAATVVGCIHLLPVLCVLFASNRIFLPITELDNGRFGNDAASADVDDELFDVCDVNDEFVTLDAVVVNCDVESSSSLRLLTTKEKTKH